MLEEKPKCPMCGNEDPEMLDWRTDENWNMVWECFECEHEWKEKI